jgi:hypothetical protein
MLILVLDLQSLQEPGQLALQSSTHSSLLMRIDWISKTEDNVHLNPR